jgi:hypothetical protein
LTAHSQPNEIENGGLGKPIGRALKVAPRQSGGTAYASAAQLASLGAYLTRLTEITTETGWHTPTMIVAFGDSEAESIVVGVRWVGDAYYAEIR